jgi:hypothetical protein
MSPDLPRPEQAAAVRRASAYLLHHGNGDAAGVTAIVEELNQDPLATGYFVEGMAIVFETLVPVIYSEAGKWLVQQTLNDLAAIEHGGKP